MQGKIETLEKLVNETCKQLKKSEQDRTALELQVKGLAAEVEKLQISMAELRKFKDWRHSVKTKLEKTALKLEQFLESQKG